MTFTLVLPPWFRRVARPAVRADRAFDLLPGQRRDLVLAPGGGLRVAAGEVVLLRPPRWLGEALVAPAATRLREGDAWTSAEREHVTLVASANSRVASA